MAKQRSKQDKNVLWFVVCPVTRARLCQDNRYRNFAMLGNMSWCVKFYKSQAWATKAAKRYRTKVNIKKETLIKALHPGESLDASGQIWPREE